VTDRVRVTAWVSGQVQGVGYRAFVGREAGRRHLAGSATNLSDGRVEVVAVGPATAVRALVDELSGAAAPGRVTGVEVADETVARTDEDPARFTLG
jgi:acylphosphatase